MRAVIVVSTWCEQPPLPCGAGGAHNKMSTALEVNEMNGATDKQLRCIRVLCSKLGKPVPVGMDGWSREQASEYISSIGRQVDGRDFSQDVGQGQLQNRKANGSTGLSRDEQVRLGLASKLVHQQWAVARKRPINGAQEQFKKEVLDLYGLLGEVEQQVVVDNRGGLHA